MARKRITHVKLHVGRLDEKDGELVDRDYTVKVTKHMSVLDALLEVKEKEDPTLSFRYSCRMGICGSCAMVIDGKPRLACETIATEEARADGEGVAEIDVEPIRGQPLLRGLVTDFDDFFEKHRETMPWIHRARHGERADYTKEIVQTDEQRDMYLPFAECIKCGLCLDACPVVNTNKNFIGPQALAQAYRYSMDSRDNAAGKRLAILDTEDGAWGCEFAGACSEVCPKSVDPALAIQLLKAEIAKKRITDALKGGGGGR